MGQAGQSQAMREAGAKFDTGERRLLQLKFQDLSRRSAQGDSIDKATFLRAFPWPGMLGERLFRQFDTKGSGTIDYEEFICGLAICCRGEADERMRFVFEVHDLDGSGLVRKSELRQLMGHLPHEVVVALETGAVGTDDDRNHLEVVDLLVDRIFEELGIEDSPRAGLDYEQFQEWLHRYPGVESYLQGFFPYGQTKTGGLAVPGAAQREASVRSRSDDEDALSPSAAALSPSAVAGSPSSKATSPSSPANAGPPPFDASMVAGDGQILAAQPDQGAALHAPTREAVLDAADQPQQPASGAQPMGLVCSCCNLVLRHCPSTGIAFNSSTEAIFRKGEGWFLTNRLNRGAEPLGAAGWPLMAAGLAQRIAGGARGASPASTVADPVAAGGGGAGGTGLSNPPLLGGRRVPFGADGRVSSQSSLDGAGSTTPRERNPFVVQPHMPKGSDGASSQRSAARLRRRQRRQERRRSRGKEGEKQKGSLLSRIKSLEAQAYAGAADSPGDLTHGDRTPGPDTPTGGPGSLAPSSLGPLGPGARPQESIPLVGKRFRSTSSGSALLVAEYDSESSYSSSASSADRSGEESDPEAVMLGAPPPNGSSLAQVPMRRALSHGDQDDPQEAVLEMPAPADSRSRSLGVLPPPAALAPSPGATAAVASTSSALPPAPPTQLGDALAPAQPASSGSSRAASPHAHRPASGITLSYRAVGRHHNLQHEAGTELVGEQHHQQEHSMGDKGWYEAGAGSSRGDRAGVLTSLADRASGATGPGSVTSRHRFCHFCGAERQSDAWQPLGPGTPAWATVQLLESLARGSGPLQQASQQAVQQASAPAPPGSPEGGVQGIAGMELTTPASLTRHRSGPGSVGAVASSDEEDDSDGPRRSPRRRRFLSDDVDGHAKLAEQAARTKSGAVAAALPPPTTPPQAVRHGRQRSHSEPEETLDHHIHHLRVPGEGRPRDWNEAQRPSHPHANGELAGLPRPHPLSLSPRGPTGDGGAVTSPTLHAALRAAGVSTVGGAPPMLDLGAPAAGTAGAALSPSMLSRIPSAGTSRSGLGGPGSAAEEAGSPGPGAAPRFSLGAGHARTARVAGAEMVEHNGWLYKRGSVMKMMTKRYYYLQANFLYSYSRRSQHHPRGVVFLEGSYVRPISDATAEAKGFFGFIINTSSAHGDLSRTLYADSREGREEWVAVLRRACRSSQFEEEYEKGEAIGQGRFSRVFAAVNRRTGQRLAVKVINKSALQESERELLRTEIAILKLVRHPHIIRLENVYETSNTIYIVMELLEGGELFDRIVGRARFSEEEARNLMRPLVEAVAYLHSLGIAHRDIKPENLLCGKKLNQVKIADFGLSKLVHPRETLRMPCGTLSYVAPEVLSMQGYGRQADLWSIGVILHLIVRGKLPFVGDSKDEVIPKIIAGKVLFNSKVWRSWSAEGIDFVRSLLQRDPKRRLTARQALQHPWLTQDFVGEAPSTPLPAAAGGARPRTPDGDD